MAHIHSTISAPSRLKITQHAVIYGLFLVLAACSGRKSDDQNEDAKNRRAGRVVPQKGNFPVDGTYGSSFSDTRPSISADGSKVGFISNRKGKLLPYIYTYSAEAKPQPLMSQGKAFIDLPDVADYFDDFLVLPDGVSTILKGKKSGAETLFLQDYAGQNAVVTLTTDQDSKSQLVSSSDSKLVAFVRSAYSTSGTKTSQVYIIDLSNISAPQVYAVSDGTVSEDAPVFTFATSPYVLVTHQTQADGKGTSVVSRSFSTASAAASATATVLTKDQGVTSGIGGAIGTGSVLIGHTYKLGEKVTSETGKVVKSLPAKVSLAGGDPGIYTQSPGTEVIQLGGSQSGDFSFWLIRNFFAANASQYGNSLVVMRESTAALSVIQPRTSTAASGWELGQDAVSTQRADGSAGVLDYSLDRVAFAQSSTTDAYQLVYQTQFSGDTEIRMIRVANGAAAFNDVSHCVLGMTSCD